MDPSSEVDNGKIYVIRSGKRKYLDVNTCAEPGGCVGGVMKIVAKRGSLSTTDNVCDGIKSSGTCDAPITTEAECRQAAADNKNNGVDSNFGFSNVVNLGDRSHGCVTWNNVYYFNKKYSSTTIDDYKFTTSVTADVQRASCYRGLNGPSGRSVVTKTHKIGEKIMTPGDHPDKSIPVEGSTIEKNKWTHIYDGMGINKTIDVAVNGYSQSPVMDRTFVVYD